MVDKIPKARHGLIRQAVDNKDKQNYDSITLLLDKNVEIWFNELNDKLRTNGTKTYLTIMRNIRDAVFNKALSTITRLHYIWRTVYFLRVWRIWLTENGYTESEHFVTQNTHMMTNTVVNVKGRFSKDTLRFWLSGSQAREQTFRLLRSMTPTFSTSVNFSMKGILQRVHKLSYLSAAESAEYRERFCNLVRRRQMHLLYQPCKKFFTVLK